MNIYQIDWFLNRNSLGKFNFDKSGAIYNFVNTTVAETLYGSKINDLYGDPRLLERECEAINILINKNKPAKVTIHNQNNDCYTDGYKIVISGLPLKEMKHTGIDIVLGFLAHEASHIRFTDMYYCKEAVKKNKMVKWIWNLLEDEVIEEMLQLEKPGLGNVLAPVKDYMFNDKKNPTFNDDIDIINYILFNIIRYPINLNKINKKNLDKFESLFNDIYAILKVNNILNIYIKEKCTSETYKAACEIYELIKHYIKENDLELPPCNSAGQGGEGDDNGDPIDKMLNDKFDDNGEINSKAFENISTEIGSTPFETNNETKLKENIENLSKHPIEVNDYDPTYNETEEDSIRGNAPTKFLSKKTKIANGKNTEKYNMAKNSVKPYIKAIQKIHIAQTKRAMTLHKEENTRNGSLDPRLLASAMQNVKNVYQRHGVQAIREKNKKFTVVLALDESGSMCGKDTRDIVNKIAITFAEAFKDNKDIDMYIYGHSDYIVQYVTPKDKYYDILIDRYQGMGQNEVLAYNGIIRDINKDNNSNILFVNVTDSQYLSNYSEIEDEMRKWNKNIFQSLIVVNQRLTEGDIDINNRIYGKDNWGVIDDISDAQRVVKELTKVVNHINELAKKYRK